MLFDTSYSDKKITKQINKAVGKPFSWRDRWKIGGIGSRRMVITDISEEYKKYLKAEHYETMANIELRPRGIIIHFRYKLQAYSWVMPFESLQMDDESGLELKSDGKFVAFNHETDQPFIRKLVSQFDNFAPKG